MKKKFDLKSKNGFYYHKSSIIDPKSDIGKNTKIWHFSHISSGSTVGEDCVLGQNTFIGSGAKIGNNVKIQNNVSVYDQVIINDDVFCGPSVVFTNVINPRSEVERKSEYKQTWIGRGVTIGANSTIVCGIKIDEYAFIAAGAVVTNKVNKFELVAGVPAVRIGWMSKYGIRMNFINKIYKCKHTNTTYKLKNNKVSIEKKT